MIKHIVYPLGEKIEELLQKRIAELNLAEVIRCKNCIHYYADPWGWGNCVFEGGVSRRTKESDFCSWGERKEDEL
jgi:hypothetical protein